MQQQFFLAKQQQYYELIERFQRVFGGPGILFADAY